MGPGFEPLRAYYGKVTPTRSPLLWRDGRVVDCIGLENRRTERYRGFESLSLRKSRQEISYWVSLFLFNTNQICLKLYKTKKEENSMLFSCCRFARAPAASSLGMGVANPLDRRGGLQRRSFGAVATWRRRQSLK